MGHTDAQDPNAIELIRANAHLSAAKIHAKLTQAGYTIGINKICQIKAQFQGTPQPAQSTPEIELPTPIPAGGGPDLPAPQHREYKPFEVREAGQWLVLSDVHLPYHDPTTIKIAVAEARKRNVAGVLLNGDLLDSHEVSDHEKDRDALDYRDELLMGQQFLAWLRGQLPRARIVYKEGNHEQRVSRYVIQRAPALDGIEGVNLPGFLSLAKHGVEWVDDKRVVQLGRLPVLHGHEYRGGGGVNPSRWLFLRSISTAMCGHFHRTSEHHQRGLNHTVHGVWSLGCACYLHPRYAPLNEWNHGFAFVTIHDSQGMFHVENRRVLNGALV